MKVDLHLYLVKAAAEGHVEGVSWALAKGADPRDPESDGDVVLEDMREQGAQQLSIVARAALSSVYGGNGTLCVRRRAMRRLRARVLPESLPARDRRPHGDAARLDERDGRALRGGQCSPTEEVSIAVVPAAIRPM